METKSGEVEILIDRSVLLESEVRVSRRCVREKRLGIVKQNFLATIHFDQRFPVVTLLATVWTLSVSGGRRFKPRRQHARCYRRYTYRTTGASSHPATTRHSTGEGHGGERRLPRATDQFT
jgi:hypothetical protein